MPQKAWYTSKIVWVGIISTVLAILPILAAYVKLISPQAATVIDATVAMLAGVLTVILRVWFTSSTLSNTSAAVATVAMAGNTNALTSSLVQALQLTTAPVAQPAPLTLPTVNSPIPSVNSVSSSVYTGKPLDNSTQAATVYPTVIDAQPPITGPVIPTSVYDAPVTPPQPPAAPQ